jgi:hypothetical protein
MKHLLFLQVDRELKPHLYLAPFAKYSKGGNPLHHFLVSIRKLRMRNYQFPIWKRGIFRPDKEIKGLRGGVHQYAAQA